LGLRKIRLIKFRSLADKDDCKRARDIIKTGKFWCSKLWNLNDPMEGVYKTTYKSNIHEVFYEKNKYVICSFSSKEALNNPLLWGYYTYGYKGIAIEIDYSEKIINDIDNEEIDNYCIVKVNYVDDNVEINNNYSVPKVISSKLKCWKHEDEYRYLNNTNSGNLFKIGKITKVYFGNPYSNTINRNQINDASEKLKDYNKYKTCLEEVCERMGIRYELYNVEPSEELNYPTIVHPF